MGYPTARSAFVPGLITALTTFASTGAMAQQTGSPAAADADVQEIIVRGTNVYRDRTNDINPTLQYDLDFFQRFEPLTVGEMLKRTPGVVFTSDVLEYDAVQLRGMGAEYTEILINGRAIPGQGADRTFFVDRIPAELVESVEIIRSPSADMSGEGVAGSLNIVLKDGAQLEGVIARLASTYYADDDNEFRQTGSLSVAEAGSGYDYWLGLNVQERRNPKSKIEEYYDDGQALEGYAFEDDTRDGTDYSLNGSAGYQMGGGELRVNGYYVFTDRTETELVDEFEGSAVSRTQGDLVADAYQLENIDQTSWGFDGVYTALLGNGELALSGAVSGYDEDTDEIERENEYEDGVLVESDEDTGRLDINDRNYSGEVSYTTSASRGLELKYGASYRLSEREGTQDGLFTVDADIEETRFAPYLMLTREVNSGLSIEGGLRYDLYDREVSSEDGTGDQDGGELLPSLSLRYDATDADRFTASIARTLRRPEFDLVTPFREEEEPDDEHLTIGNPDLDSEVSWGLDVGYERRLPGRGIAGINVFYRDVQDVIEITDTGVPFPDGGGSTFTFRNIGDGTTRGVEVDLSTPLDFIGLDNTGFYMNYAYMDSEITDPWTGVERTFRHQPDYVFNASLTQDIPALDAGAGISYQKRGRSLETEYDEFVITAYDGNMELFFEKNFGENTVLRLSGTNLLDQEKVEYIRDYGDPVNEIQYEQSSRTFTVTLRSGF